MGFKNLMKRIRHKKFKIKAEELAEKWNVLGKYLPLCAYYSVDAEAESWLDYVHHKDEYLDYDTKIESSKVQFWGNDKVEIRLTGDNYEKMIEREGRIF